MVLQIQVLHTFLPGHIWSVMCRPWVCRPLIALDPSFPVPHFQWTQMGSHPSTCIRLMAGIVGEPQSHCGSRYMQHTASVNSWEVWWTDNDGSSRYILHVHMWLVGRHTKSESVIYRPASSLLCVLCAMLMYLELGVTSWQSLDSGTTVKLTNRVRRHSCVLVYAVFSELIDQQGFAWMRGLTAVKNMTRF